MSDLPPGWAETSVGTIAASLSDGPFGSSLKSAHYQPSGARVIRLQNIADGWFDDRDKAYVSLAHFNSLKRHEARPGDVLIAALGVVLPRVCLVPPGIGCAIVKADCFRLRPYKGVLASYLAYILSAPQTRKRASTEIAGVGRPRLNLRKVSALPIPVPPTAEQARIVNAIEEQFSRLDAGVAALERVCQNLKRMRTAVLQGAVTDALGCTDQGTTPLADFLSAPLANGKSVPDGNDSGFPVLRLTAVRDGWIDVAFSKKGAWTAAEAKPYVIRKGDYLVVRGNGSKHLVGRGAMVGVDSEVAYPDTLIRLRFDETMVVPRYAGLIWNSRTVRDQIEGAARTTAGIYKINQKDLGQVAFPVPSIEDQVRILASADGVLHAIGILEIQLNAQLQRSNALRSSILAAAFSGKIVPQDSNDDPASVLLEQIAAERASSNGHKPPRTRKPRAPREKVTV